MKLPERPYFRSFFRLYLRQMKKSQQFEVEVYTSFFFFFAKIHYLNMIKDFQLTRFIQFLIPHKESARPYRLVGGSVSN